MSDTTDTTTKLGRRNPPAPLVGDTMHAWRLTADAAGEWAAQHVEIQAPPVNIWPVSVTAQRGVHPLHIATALRALADHIECDGAPMLRVMGRRNPRPSDWAAWGRDLPAFKREIATWTTAVISGYLQAAGMAAKWHPESLEEEWGGDQATLLEILRDEYEARTTEAAS